MQLFSNSILTFLHSNSTTWSILFPLTHPFPPNLLYSIHTLFSLLSKVLSLFHLSNLYKPSIYHTLSLHSSLFKLFLKSLINSMTKYGKYTVLIFLHGKEHIKSPPISSIINLPIYDIHILTIELETPLLTTALVILQTNSTLIQTPVLLLGSLTINLISGLLCGPNTTPLLIIF